jgi:hypothetical protein
VASLFERLAQGRPAPVEEKIKPPQNELAPAQKLLDWLQRWSKPTISMRDIRIYGPRPIRARESAINSAQTLVRHGWLIPTQTHRHDRHVWQIVHKTIVGPAVAAE